MKKTKNTKNIKTIELLRVMVRAVRVACQSNSFAWTKAEELLAVLENREPWEHDLPLTRDQAEKLDTFYDILLNSRS